jgi:hypothetical protein
VNIQFDGNKTVTETDVANATESGSYTINTEGDFDYINISGSAPGIHQYKIETLQSRALTLSETLNFTNGVAILVNGKYLTYYKSEQVSNYSKNNFQ